ncbi:MAG TPA: pyridoxal phosphate-dependent aminotransferase family protein [Bacteroidia bacterium]|nr:pyridoxal phosphate-dependent aminotransferase family protein [Bacteroidia bacterium]
MSASGPENILSQRLKKRFAENALRTLRPADFSKADFSSNDYLGFARSNALLDRCGEEWVRINHAVDQRFLGSGGSRLLSGDSVYAHDVEKYIAGFFRSETALIFNSGYTANLSLFSALPSRTGTVIFDDFIHASVRDGIRVSGCRAWSFRHNDLNHLEELLQKAGEEIWVVAESVYSMDGDSPDPERLVALCEKHNAALIIDEAHSAGLMGEGGRGFCVQHGIENRVFARLYTFGKAFGVHGAAVCGNHTLINYLVNFARPFIYSTALPAHDLAAIKTSLDFSEESGFLRSELRSLTSHFKETASSSFLKSQLVDSDSPIQGIIIPGNLEVRRVAEVCQARGMDVRPVLSPTVKSGSERLRIILHAYNTREEIDKLIQAISWAVVNK